MRKKYNSLLVNIFFYENVIILYLFINKTKVNAMNEIYITLMMFKSCYFVFPMNLNCFQFKFTFALKQNFLLMLKSQYINKMYLF